MPEKFRIAAEVPRELRERLEAHARATGRTASAVMRGLIAAYVPDALDPTRPVPHHFQIVWRVEDGHLVARVAEFPHPGWHIQAFNDEGRTLAEDLLRTMTGPHFVVTHIPPAAVDDDAATP